MSTPNTVTLRGLSARGYHGVLPSERAEGQIFSADVTLFWSRAYSTGLRLVTTSPKPWTIHRWLTPWWMLFTASR